MTHEPVPLELDPDFHVAEHLFALSEDIREHADANPEIRMAFVKGAVVWVARVDRVQAKGHGPIDAMRRLLIALGERRRASAA